MNFISSIAWVPRGKSKHVPDEIRLDTKELKELYAAQPVEEGDEDAIGSEPDEEADGSRDAKEDVGDPEEEEVPTEGSGFSIHSLSVFPTNEDDPYIEVKDSEDIDSEDEDFRILPQDNLLAVAHIDEDASVLEIYVYNQEKDDLYVHHDMILPAFPLAVEWISYQPGQSDEQGNYVAVGSMEDAIQVWDLDVVNAMKPAFELKSRTKKRKRRDKTSAGLSGHSDAVLALAWNPVVPHVFASGSADQTVVLWDLDEGKPADCLRSFQDKVQAIRWRPGCADQILCGSCDKTVRLFDCRYKKAKHIIWNVEGEVERVLWTLDTNVFHVACETGMLYTCDVRNPSIFLSSVQAHEKSITGLSCSALVPGFLVTASEDKRIKVWDMNGSSNVPEMIFERKLKMGDLQFATMSPDSPFVAAIGGEDSDNNFRVLDLYKISEEIQERFHSRIPADLRGNFVTKEERDTIKRHGQSQPKESGNKKAKPRRTERSAAFKISSGARHKNVPLKKWNSQTSRNQPGTSGSAHGSGSQ